MKSVKFITIPCQLSYPASEYKQFDIETKYTSKKTDVC